MEKNGKINTNSNARYFASQILFAYNEQENVDELKKFIEEYYIKDEFKEYEKKTNLKLLENLLTESVKNIKEIDAIIEEKVAPKFTLNTLEHFVLTIFRLAIYELKFSEKKLDKKIIVSEYVDIAGEFLEKKIVAFVNAVLDGIKD